jgi:hypothetical protein
MANTVRHQALTRSDDKRYKATFRFWLSSPDDATATGTVNSVATALAALTNAAGFSARGPVSSGPVLAAQGATAVYADAVFKALFTFQAADFSLHRYQVMAPKESIFLADLMTVDRTNIDVAAFITAMTGAIAGSFVSSEGGSQVTSYLDGFLIRRRNRRRISGLTIASDLAVPAL